jgi:hypothetical protein
MQSHPSTSKPVPQPWSNAQAPTWTTKLRPLSDIREITEPSLLDSPTSKKHDAMMRGASLVRENSITRKDSMKRQASTLTRKCSQQSIRGEKSTARILRQQNLDPVKQGNIISPDSQTDRSSAYSFSLEDIPGRSPSKSRADLRERSVPHLQIRNTPKRLQPWGHSTADRAVSKTPIKELISDLGRLRSEHEKYPRSRTLVRTHDPNIDIIEFPTHRHPRLSVELHLGATLFVGGGSIDGHIRVSIDEVGRTRHKRQLAISRISIDLLGLEEIAGPKRSVFLNLTTELIDSDNPPPHIMVESLKQISPVDPFWHLAPSTSNIPFLLSLPLDVGPPPFSSRHARIRYVLGVTLLIRDQGKQFLVRTSQDVSVISVYDRKSKTQVDIR